MKPRIQIDASKISAYTSIGQAATLEAQDRIGTELAEQIVKHIKKKKLVILNKNYLIVFY